MNCTQNFPENSCYQWRMTKLDELHTELSREFLLSVAYAEICEGGGFGTEKTIALSGPGNGQKLQKLGLHSKTKCYAFKNILQ